MTIDQSGNAPVAAKKQAPTVRAKFQVQNINRAYAGSSADGPQETVTVQMNPVYGTQGENKAFWDATPNGSITMCLTQKSASEMFKNGDVFYIDFTPADAS